MALRTTFSIAFALTLPLLLLGCEIGPSTGGTTGELGVGKFSYVCLDAGDYACAGTFTGREADESEQSLRDVAVEAKFGVRFAGKVGTSGEGPDVELEAVSLGDALNRNTFLIHSEVDATILAIKGNGRIVDYIVISALEAKTLVLEMAGEIVPNEVEMALGESLELVAAPKSEKGKSLYGSMRYVWTLNHPELATMNSEGGFLRFTPSETGRVVLTVTSGKLSAQIRIEIK